MFPAQWEGKTFDDKFVFIHYRHGILRASISVLERHAIIGSDAAFNRVKDFEQPFHGEMSNDDMVAYLGTCLDFKRCSFKKDKIHNYEFSGINELTPDEYKNEDVKVISGDKTMINKFNNMVSIPDLHAYLMDIQIKTNAI